MAEVYQIKNWDDHFENDRSRRVDECRFVCIPNKFGLGLRRLLAKPRGHEMFGVFVLIIEALSTQPKPRTGWLTDDGTKSGEAWSAEDVAIRVSHNDPTFIRNTLEVLSSKEVGWIAHHQLTTHSPSTHVEGRKEGREGKEGKKEESAEKSAAAIAAPSPELDSRKPHEPTANGKPHQPPTPTSSPKLEAEPIRLPKPRKEPTGDHAELIRHYVARWEARYNAKLPFSSKDANHIKWILKQVKNLQQARDAVDGYLESEDKFYVNDRHGIGLLVAQFRKFIDAKPGRIAPLQKAVQRWS